MLERADRKANKNIIMSSFKSSRDIQKKEGGPIVIIQNCVTLFVIFFTVIEHSEQSLVKSL